METLAYFGWLDLAILVLLAIGAFIGFVQGVLRYLVGVAAVLVAFLLAAHLREPLSGMLGVWEAFPPQGRELFFFLLLFFVLVIAGWLIIRAVYGHTRLRIARQLDELAGAVLGVLFVLVIISLHIVVLDSFYRVSGAEETGFLGSYYGALNDSVVVSLLREYVIPAIGFLLRPLLPREIAQLLRS